MTTPAPDLLTAREVAAMLRSSKDESYRLAARGLLATVRWNRRVYFTRESVGLFLTRHTTPARRNFLRPNRLSTGTRYAGERA